MSHSGDASIAVPAMTSHKPSEISGLSQRVSKILRAFGEARGRGGMTSDEVLIFLAVGHMGQTVNSVGVLNRPVTCLDLGVMLCIPKETVRRKVTRLVELRLAKITRRGVLIQDNDEWHKLAELISGNGSC